MTTKSPQPGRLSNMLPRDRNQRTVVALFALFGGLIAFNVIVFRVLMAEEGHPQSWFTALYWTFQTMSTLGDGDLVFVNGIGRVFSLFVLLTGIVFLFILLPFTLIQYVYAPWLERRHAGRAPRVVAPTMSGHVILTAYSPVEAALIGRLERFNTPYVVIVPDV